MTLKDIRTREKTMDSIRKYLSGLMVGSREYNNYEAMLIQLKHEVDVAKSQLNKEELEMLRKME